MLPVASRYLPLPLVPRCGNRLSWRHFTKVPLNPTTIAHAAAAEILIFAASLSDGRLLSAHSRRSCARYSAYALCSIDYLYKTSGPRVRKEFDAEGSKKWAESAEWNGIEILAVENGGEQDETGMIEFIAHYTIKDTPFDHHEKAQFAKVGGEWRFIDGDVIGPEPIGARLPRSGATTPAPRQRQSTRNAAPRWKPTQRQPQKTTHDQGLLLRPRWYPARL